MFIIRLVRTDALVNKLQTGWMISLHIYKYSVELNYVENKSSSSSLDDWTQGGEGAGYIKSWDIKQFTQKYP